MKERVYDHVYAARPVASTTGEIRVVPDSNALFEFVPVEEPPLVTELGGRALQHLAVDEPQLPDRPKLTQEDDDDTELTPYQEHTSSYDYDRESRYRQAKRNEMMAGFYEQAPELMNFLDSRKILLLKPRDLETPNNQALQKKFAAQFVTEIEMLSSKSRWAILSLGDLEDAGTLRDDQQKLQQQARAIQEALGVLVLEEPAYKRLKSIAFDQYRSQQRRTRGVQRAVEKRGIVDLVELGETGPVYRQTDHVMDPRTHKASIMGEKLANARW